MRRSCTYLGRFGCSIALLLCLSSCEKSSEEPTQVEQQQSPAAEDVAEAQQQPTAAKQIAEWHSYSILSPQYGAELLRIYSDLSCSIAATATNTAYPCQWSRGDGDQIAIEFPDSNTKVTALLGAARSSEGKQRPETEAYLDVDLGGAKPQQFVLANSPDAAMIRAAVDGELALQQGNNADAIALLKQASSAGELYSRARLGLVLALSNQPTDLDAAIQLLSPTPQASSTWIEHLLAVSLLDAAPVVQIGTASLGPPSTPATAAINTASTPAADNAQRTNNGASDENHEAMRSDPATQPRAAVEPKKAKEKPAATAPKTAPTTSTQARTVASAKPSTPPKGPSWIIQVASVGSNRGAEKLRDNLRGKGYSAYVEQAVVKGKNYFRVRIGPEYDRGKANAIAARVQQETGQKPLIYKR